MSRVAFFALLLLIAFLGLALLPVKKQITVEEPIETVSAPIQKVLPLQPIQKPPAQKYVVLRQTVPERKPDPTYGTHNGIPILMFHRLMPQPRDILEMTAQEFKLVLKSLRDQNFCPIALRQYLNNRFPLNCVGKKLFAATFDDSHHSQLELTAGKISAQSALGIWRAVFPKSSATFFINLKNGGPPFRDNSAKKLKLLKELGFAIENHTISHQDLSKAAAVRVGWEVGGVCKKLGRDSMLLAYPFGLLPEKSITSYNTGCQIEYAFSAREGYFEPRPGSETETNYDLLAPLPNDPRFKNLRYNIPRININSLQDLKRDVIDNPGVYRLSSE